MSASELVPCPGGCGREVHKRASECPQCGFQSEANTYQELLGSLSTVSSILVGFGLASIVTVAAEQAEYLQDLLLRIANGLWLFASMLLLAVLLMAEFLRRRGVGENVIAMSYDEQQRMGDLCGRLLSTFAFALFLIASGIVLLGFHLSLYHGIAGIVSTCVAGWLIWITVRR
ncbi:MAG: hypothetical protein ACFCD0_03215 [Gemmataceae bacterium]